MWLRVLSVRRVIRGVGRVFGPPHGRADEADAAIELLTRLDLSPPGNTARCATPSPITEVLSGLVGLNARASWDDPPVGASTRSANPQSACLLSTGGKLGI
jgi:hypothetical protein